MCFKLLPVPIICLLKRHSRVLQHITHLLMDYMLFLSRETARSMWHKQLFNDQSSWLWRSKTSLSLNLRGILSHLNFNWLRKIWCNDSIGWHLMSLRDLLYSTFSNCPSSTWMGQVSDTCFTFTAISYDLEGYKLHTWIAKALQTRSEPIQKALTCYNTEAAKLSPPLPKVIVETDCWVWVPGRVWPVERVLCRHSYTGLGWSPLLGSNHQVSAVWTCKGGDSFLKCWNSTSAHIYSWWRTIHVKDSW